MLPNAEDLPTVLGKEHVRVPILPAVTLNLRGPVVRVGFWLHKVQRTAMPEAAVNVYGESCAAKN
jgi:hypothetical protein